MAKAEAGHRYAVIQDGQCHWKFDTTTLPEWHDALRIVDITALIPEPDEGDLYDGAVFSKPIVPPSAPPATREELDARGRMRIQNDKLLLALIAWLADRFGIMPAQARDEIITIYKEL